MLKHQFRQLLPLRPGVPRGLGHEDGVQGRVGLQVLVEGVVQYGLEGVPVFYDGDEDLWVMIAVRQTQPGSTGWHMMSGELADNTHGLVEFLRIGLTHAVLQW